MVGHGTVKELGGTEADNDQLIGRIPWANARVACIQTKRASQQLQAASIDDISLLLSLQRHLVVLLIVLPGFWQPNLSEIDSNYFSEVLASWPLECTFPGTWWECTSYTAWHSPGSLVLILILYAGPVSTTFRFDADRVGVSAGPLRSLPLPVYLPTAPRI